MAKKKNPEVAPLGRRKTFARSKRARNQKLRPLKSQALKRTEGACRFRFQSGTDAQTAEESGFARDVLERDLD